MCPRVGHNAAAMASISSGSARTPSARVYVTKRSIQTARGGVLSMAVSISKPGDTRPSAPSSSDRLRYLATSNSCVGSCSAFDPTTMNTVYLPGASGADRLSAPGHHLGALDRVDGQRGEDLLELLVG